MNKYEKQFIAGLPEKYRPMEAWTYYAYSVLFSLPLSGILFLLLFSFSKENNARRNFARSFFCSFFVELFIFASIAFILYKTGVFAMIAEFIEQIKSLPQE